jgi:hypothetical protein
MLATVNRMLPLLWPEVAASRSGYLLDAVLTAVIPVAGGLFWFGDSFDGFGKSLDDLPGTVSMRGGHQFHGEIDWSPSSRLGIVDFKWGLAKYEQKFANKNFGQLAIYAWNRLHREQRSGLWPGKTLADVEIRYWSLRDNAIRIGPSSRTQSVIDALEAMLILVDELFGTHRRAIAWPLLPPHERLKSEPAGTPLAADLDDWKTHLPRQSGAARDPADTWHICEYCKLDRICGKHSVR